MNTEKEKNFLKRTDPQIIFFTINKELNSIESGDIKTKKDSIEILYNYIVNDKPKLKSEIIQEILISFNKSFIKLAFSNSLEKCREYSIKILI